MTLDKEINEKRPELSTLKGVIFHRDNTRPHTSLVTRKNKLIQFFASKNQTFYESGIMKLTERCQKAIEQNGQ